MPFPPIEVAAALLALVALAGAGVQFCRGLLVLRAMSAEVRRLRGGVRALGRDGRR